METLKALLEDYFTPVHSATVEMSIIPNYEDGANLIPCTDLVYQIDSNGDYVVWHDDNLVRFLNQ